MHTLHEATPLRDAPRASAHTKGPHHGRQITEAAEEGRRPKEDFARCEGSEAQRFRARFGCNEAEGQMTFGQPMNEYKANRRWPRSERFELSESGRKAAQSYLDMIVASRAEEGRRAFDEARKRWSDEFGVSAEDALCMREMVSGATTLVALVEQLDGCGPDRKQVKEALERMLEKGLISPIESTRS